VTLYFSHSTPNLSMVIPAMDHIDATFANGIIQKEPLHPAIHTAIQLAKKTLNWYYSLTDSSEVYRIAMGIFFSTSQNYPSTNNVALQFSTHDTNWLISRKPDGMWSGLQPLKALFMSSTSGAISHVWYLLVSPKIQVQCWQIKWYVDCRFVLDIFLTVTISGRQLY
jgi:hypothetical protein